MKKEGASSKVNIIKSRVTKHARTFGVATDHQYVFLSIYDDWHDVAMHKKTQKRLKIPSRNEISKI